MQQPAQALTLATLCNQYLNDKTAAVRCRELTQRTLREYWQVCKLLIDRFGRDRLVTDLGPDDFGQLRAHMAKRWGPVRLGNTIQAVRSVFK